MKVKAEPSIYDFVMENLKGLPLTKLIPIAEATGVSANTIYKIGSGFVKDPGVRKIEKLAAYFRGLEKKK